MKSRNPLSKYLLVSALSGAAILASGAALYAAEEAATEAKPAEAAQPTADAAGAAAPGSAVVPSPSALGTSTAAISPLDKEDKPWSIDLMYKTSTDFADELSPRLYTHVVTAEATYDIPNWFGVSVESGYFYKTVGSSVSKFPEDSGLTSVDLSVFRKIGGSFGNFLGGKHTLLGMVSSSFPFTEDARLEGYYGSLGVGPTFISKFFDGDLRVRQSAYYNFIFNRFDYSPGTADATTTNSYGYSIGASYRLIGQLRAGVGFGLRRSRYTDGFHDFAYNNTQSLSYLWGNWMATVSHTNGGYTDDGNVELWYVDKYRRIISGSIGYTF